VSAATTLPSTCDVFVVGTGIAGLVTAIRAGRAGLDVVVIDSAEEWGGTTALGGGRVWIPANGTPENAGDSREAALRYLEQVFGEDHPQHLEAFVDTVNDAADFVATHTAHRFVVCPNYPDYHPHLEGATTGGRCFDTSLVRLEDLRPEAAAVRRAPSYAPLTHAEWEQWRYPDRIDTDLVARRSRDDVLTGGPGMAAALVDGALRAGVRLWSGTTLRDVIVMDGQIVGAEVTGPDGSQQVAAKAVVLATGGFDADPAQRAALLPAALGVSASAPTNTGVALAVAQRLGLPVDNLGDGWWMPMIQLPGETVDGHPYPRALIRERGVPRLIVVDGSGQRFLNESLPYNEFGKAVHAQAEEGSGSHAVTWVIMDQGFHERYPFPGLALGQQPGAHVVQASTLVQLATAIGLPTAALEATVEEWNIDCAAGHDRRFGKGDNAYDRYYGDPFTDGHPNIGPLDRPPFYAVRVHSGCISSKGGPVTTVDGQAQWSDGTPVPGLYVVGTASATWTGAGYPGPGTPLAIGMTWGFRAAGHMLSHLRGEGGS